MWGGCGYKSTAIEKINASAAIDFSPPDLEFMSKSYCLLGGLKSYRIFLERVSSFYSFDCNSSLILSQYGISLSIIEREASPPLSPVSFEYTSFTRTLTLSKYSKNLPFLLFKTVLKSFYKIS